MRHQPKYINKEKNKTKWNKIKQNHNKTKKYLEVEKLLIDFNDITYYCHMNCADGLYNISIDCETQ